MRARLVPAEEWAEALPPAVLLETWVLYRDLKTGKVAKMERVASELPKEP